MVFEASRKRKLVTKSPTKSELVALIDHIGFVYFLGLLSVGILQTPNNIPIQYIRHFVEGRSIC